MRQMARADYLVEKINQASTSEDDQDDLFDVSGMFDPTSTHRSDKKTKNPTLNRM